jgi:16S rRNA (guanine966-N2)-methyltransferase
MTRIISGKYRGKRIAAPKNLPTRPTTDMAKESLFNILNNRFYFDELKCLDLFAGTGNISYELASRGCEHIVAVDSSHACVKFIDKISDELNTTGLFPVKSDVYEYLDREYNKFDLIFADPPFEFDEKAYEKLIDKVFFKNLLAEDGLLVVEHQERMKLDHLDNFVEDRKYGNLRFSFFEHEADSTDTEETT